MREQQGIHLFGINEILGIRLSTEIWVRLVQAMSDKATIRLNAHPSHVLTQFAFILCVL